MVSRSSRTFYEALSFANAIVGSLWLRYTHVEMRVLRKRFLRRGKIRTLVGACGLLFGAFFAQPVSAFEGLDVEAELRLPGVKLLAVEFFATWCKPCMDAVPRWKALHDKYRSEGLRFVVVTSRDPGGSCQSVGWTPDRTICDDDGFLQDRFGAQKLPSAFLWGWQGHLLASKVHIDQVEGKIRSWMRSGPRVDLETVSVNSKARVSKRELETILRDALLRQDKITVVASAEERKRLQGIIQRSLRLGADESLACEVGKEVTANSLLKASVTGRARQTLRLQLFSAERGCLVASSSAPWYPEKGAVSASQAVASLLGKVRLPRIQLPFSAPVSLSQEGVSSPKPSAIDDTSYEAILARAEAAKRAEAEAAEAARKAREAAEEARRLRLARLEKAWVAVRTAATTSALPRGDRIVILKKFLKDYPDNNPHFETAQKYQNVLRSGREPVGASEDMIQVPGGRFFMGCNEKVDKECADDEKPGRTVSVKTFFIDRTEVTVEAYAECVKAGECSDYHLTGVEWKDLPGWDDRPFTKSEYCNWGKRGREKHPINCVDWNQASKFCAWKRKRLPTEIEWEKATRGTDGRKYPWGNQQVTCDYAILNDGGYGCGRTSTWPVGSKPAGKSPYGALDMVGNVWEWTSSWWDESERKFRVVRGGSWDTGPAGARASNRSGLTPDFRSRYGGFRCLSGHSGS